MKNHIKFEFYQSHRFYNKNDVLEVIRSIQSCGVTLATYHREPKESPKILPFAGSLYEYVDEKCQEVELVDGDEVPLHLRSGPIHLSGAGLAGNIVPGVNQSFSFVLDMFGLKFNMVAGSLITRQENVGVFAKFFVEIAQNIYSTLQPAFGIVDYAGMVPGTIFKEVPARKIKRIYWATFLGPDYIDKYGKNFFLNAPILKKEVLQDGGMFLQVSESITKPSTVSSLDETKKYFAQIGVKQVSWTHEKPRSG